VSRGRRTENGRAGGAGADGDKVDEGERDLDCGPAVPTNQRPKNSLRRPSMELLYKSCRLSLTHQAHIAPVVHVVPNQCAKHNTHS
jgi:hypothetical protein